MTAVSPIAALTGGFCDPPVQSARAFRALLDVMARPGTIGTLTGAQPPAPLSVAAGVTLLTLADGSTPVHLAGALDCAVTRDWIAFHTGAPLAGAEAAAFAVGRWDDLVPLERFGIGLPDYPDRAATLIIEVDRLDSAGPRLTGPGIPTPTRLSLPEVAAFRANRALYPLGFDCVLTCGDRLAGLPRSTVVGDV